MARWLTPRRCLVYSAYFVGVFSLLIGLFISRHVWDIHTTVRIVEKSWDVRGHDHRNLSWTTKAVHALFAGHEDASEYNDLFWAKYDEISTVENGQGSFDRSNLTTCDDGYAPEWADANAGYDKWGFVLYRTDYYDDDETWAQFVKYLNDTIRTHLEIEATHTGSDCDPDLVRDRAMLEIIEDRETLDRATTETIRTLWRKRVDDGLVDSTFKIGGWQYGGWLRVDLHKGAGDGESDGKNRKKANGMALNLCLVYDTSTRLLMFLANQGFPATGPRDPWEPFLLAVDGLWSNDSYTYRTSWAHGYPGYYGVALSILFNDFHGKTFEREMERQAPHMLRGYPPAIETTPWWKGIIKTLPSLGHVVARPGQFPFHDRWQETHFPYVREDSFWKDPTRPESVQAEEIATTPQESNDLDLEQFLEPTSPVFYSLCSDADENQEGCFQMGNFRVRKPSQSKTPQPTEEAVPTNDLQRDAPVEQESL